MVLLSAQNISMSYSERPLLNDVSLFIDDSDKIGLIGINGTGNSTLLKILANVEKPGAGTITTASGVRVAYLPQNPDFGDDKTVIEQVLSSANPSQQELKLYEAKSILTKLGMTEFDKKVNLLSGGQKKRVAIAAALITPCELLILDEPTAGLDPKGRDEILGELYKLHKSYNMTIILVSHSMEDVAKVADRILVMDKGKCVLDGTPKEIFKEVETLENVGLAVPQVTYLMRELKKRGFELPDDVFTLEQAKKELLRILAKN